MTANNSQTGTVVVIDQTSKKQHHSMITWVMAVAMVAVLGIGGTFAYLTFTTNAVSNDLSTTTGLKAQVVEEKWNQAGGADSATHMAPGDVVAKDPQVWNTSDNDKAFAAMELTFQKKVDGAWADMSAEDVTKLLAVYSVYAGDETPTAQAADVAINSNKWTKIVDANYTTNSAKRYYYYNDVVDTNAKTETLFDHVAILTSVTEDEITALNKAVGNEWQIVVRGAEIGAVDGDTTTTAASFIDTKNEVNWFNLFPETSSTSDTTDGE